MIETFYSLDELKNKLVKLEDERYEKYEHQYLMWNIRLELNDKLNRSWKNE